MNIESIPTAEQVAAAYGQLAKFATTGGALVARTFFVPTGDVQQRAYVDGTKVVLLPEEDIERDTLLAAMTNVTRSTASDRNHHHWYGQLVGVWIWIQQARTRVLAEGCERTDTMTPEQYGPAAPPAVSWAAAGLAAVLDEDQGDAEPRAVGRAPVLVDADHPSMLVMGVGPYGTKTARWIRSGAERAAARRLLDGQAERSA